MHLPVSVVLNLDLTRLSSREWSLTAELLPQLCYLIGLEDLGLLYFFKTRSLAA